MATKAGQLVRKSEWTPPHHIYKMVRRYGRKSTKSTRRKPSVRNAKRVVAKAHKRAAKKNLDTFFLRAKSTFLQVPSQGVLTSNYIYVAAQLLSGELQSNAEFQFYRQLYDRFRVNRVTVKVTPKANVMDAGIAQLDGAYNLSGDGVIHTVVDRDSIAPSSVAQMLRYPSYKSFSLLKKFSRSYSVTWPKGVWLDCQDPKAGNSSAILNTLGLAGGVTMYAENLIEDAGELISEPWAQLEYMWDIVFCGKAASSMSFATDEGGNVTAVTLTSSESVPSAALTPLRNLRGTIADGRFAQNTAPPDASMTDAPNQT